MLVFFGVDGGAITDLTRGFQTRKIEVLDHDQLSRVFDSPPPAGILKGLKPNSSGSHKPRRARIITGSDRHYLFNLDIT